MMARVYWYNGMKREQQKRINLRHILVLMLSWGLKLILKMAVNIWLACRLYAEDVKVHHQRTSRH